MRHRSSTPRCRAHIGCDCVCVTWRAQDGSGTIDFDEFLQMMTAKMSEKVRGA